jgi:hypothetical protein
MRSCGKRGPCPVSHSPRRLDDDEHITPTSSSRGTPQSVQLKPVDLSKLKPAARGALKHLRKSLRLPQSILRPGLG